MRHGGWRRGLDGRCAGDTGGGLGSRTVAGAGVHPAEWRGDDGGPIGHGVGWFDDHAEFELHVPACEFDVSGQTADGAFECYGSVDNRIWK